MSQTAPFVTFNHTSRPPLFLPEDEDAHMEPPSSENLNDIFTPSVSDSATGALSPHNHRTVIHSRGVLGREEPTQIMLEYPAAAATTHRKEDANPSHVKERSLTSHYDVSQDSSRSQLIQRTLGLRSCLRHIVQTHPHIHLVFEERTKDAIQKINSSSAITPPTPPTPPTSTIPAQAVQEQDTNHLDHGSNELPAIKSEETEFHSSQFDPKVMQICQLIFFYSKQIGQARSDQRRSRNRTARCRSHYRWAQKSALRRRLYLRL